MSCGSASSSTDASPRARLGDHRAPGAIGERGEGRVQVVGREAGGGRCHHGRVSPPGHTVSYKARRPETARLSSRALGVPRQLSAPKAERGRGRRLAPHQEPTAPPPPAVVPPGATPSRPGWAWARSRPRAARVRSDVQSLRGGPHCRQRRRDAQLAAIDTIVVLMLENRSFDHFLGGLKLDSSYGRGGDRRPDRGEGSRTRPGRWCRRCGWPERHGRSEARLGVVADGVQRRAQRWLRAANPARTRPR